MHVKPNQILPLSRILQAKEIQSEELSLVGVLDGKTCPGKLKKMDLLKN